MVVPGRPGRGPARGAVAAGRWSLQLGRVRTEARGGDQGGLQAQ